MMPDPQERVGKNGSKRSTSDVDVRGAQRVGLNEVATGLHLVTHQHGEHPVGFNRIFNLHAQEPAHLGVHGGFPQLFRIHLTQALVALSSDTGLGLCHEPGHGCAEVCDLVFLLALAFTALHDGLSREQALEGATRLGQRLVVGPMDKIGGDDAAFDVAVVATAYAQVMFIGAGIELG